MADTRYLILTRHFNAPPAMVYAAFTDPAQLAAWFGPVGYSVPPDSVSIDTRVGGHQRFTMVEDAHPEHGSPINATFTGVVANKLLEIVQHVAGQPGFEGLTDLTLRVEFFDDNGGTRLELSHGPYPRDIEADARIGWESSFTKLDTLLSTGLAAGIATGIAAGG